MLEKKYYKQVLDGQVINYAFCDVDEFIDLYKNRSDPDATWHEISKEEYEDLQGSEIVLESDNVNTLDKKTYIMSWCQRWNNRPSVEELDGYYIWLEK